MKKLHGILAQLAANLEYVADIYGDTILDVIVTVILLEVVILILGVILLIGAALAIL